MNKKIVGITTFMYALSVIVLLNTGSSFVVAILWSLLVAPLMWLYSAIESLDPWLASEGTEELSEKEKEIQNKSVLAGLLVFGLPLAAFIIYHVHQNA